MPPLLPGLLSSRSISKLPPLSPEEEDSLVKDVLGYGGSALSGLGAVLDTPGSSIRNMLVGRAPSVFDASQRVSGRDIWEHYGVAPKNIEGFHPFAHPMDALWDVIGFGTEVATDPLTYLTLGTSKALSTSGQVLDKVGLLPTAKFAGEKLAEGMGRRSQLVRSKFSNVYDDIEKLANSGGNDLSTLTAKERLKDIRMAADASGTTVDALRASDDPLAYIARWKLGPIDYKFGSGAWAGNIAEQVDKIGHAIRSSKPGRIAAEKFDYFSGGLKSLVGQKSASTVGRAVESSVEELNTKFAKGMQQLEGLELIEPTNWTDLRATFEGTYKLDDSTHQAIKKAFDEGIVSSEDEAIDYFAKQGINLKDFDRAFDENIANKLRGRGVDEQKIAGLKDFIGNMKKDAETYRQEINRLGGDIDFLDDPTIEWARRTHTPKDAVPHRYENIRMRYFKTTNPSNIARKDPLKRLLATSERAGGSAAIEAGMRDPLLVGQITDNGWRFVDFMTTRRGRRFKPHLDVYRQLTRPLSEAEQLSMKQHLMADGLAHEDAIKVLEGAKEFQERAKHTWEKLHYGSDVQLDRRAGLLKKSKQEIGANPFDEVKEYDNWSAWEDGFRGNNPEGQLPQAAESAYELGRRHKDIADFNANPNNKNKITTVLDEAEQADLAGLNARWEASEQFALMAEGRAVPDAGDLYWNSNVFFDMHRAALNAKQQIAGLDGLYLAVGNGAIKQAEGANLRKDHRLLSFLEKQGNGIKDTDAAIKNMAERLKGRAKELSIPEDSLERLTNPEAMAEYIDEVGSLMDEGADLTNLVKDTMKADRAAVFDHLYVDSEFADDLAHVVELWKPTKQNIGRIMGFYDHWLNTLKTHLTTPHLAFHMRNNGTANWMQLVSGSFDPSLGRWNPMAYVRPLKAGWDFAVRGKMPKGWREHPWYKGVDISEEDALMDLRAKVYGHRVSAPHENIGQEIVGASEEAERMFNANMLMGRRSKVPEMSIWEQVDPRGHRGGLGPAARKSEEIGVDTNFVIRNMNKLSSGVEDVNRFATFWAKGMQGFTPERAGLISRTTHVDYRHLTNFERNVMRRIIPFYSFSRHMIPHQLNMLMHNPGGPVAQAIRAGNVARSGEYVPEFVGRGLAIPASGAPEGQKRFISGFDLPHELLNDYLVMPRLDTSSVAGFMQSVAQWGGDELKTLMGQTHPTIKGSLEWATGQQFYSGRDLADLDSNIGRMIQNATGAENAPYVPNFIDQGLAMSPMARYMTTLRQLSDPRKQWLAKGANVVTGIKVRDVDVDKAARAATRDRLEELLRPLPDVRPYERLWIKPEDRVRLNAEQAKAMELYDRLMKR